MRSTHKQLFNYDKSNLKDNSVLYNSKESRNKISILDVVLAIFPLVVEMISGPVVVTFTLVGSVVVIYIKL